ncbi:MAG: 5-formyltetrahydrofolate cyclo-ligase [Actinomycetota bacterium]|nr:5-formyltetrahydrofolate cyclo-ligase [Actinomycetota bacterium]
MAPDQQKRKRELRESLDTVDYASHSADVSKHLVAWPPLHGRVVTYLSMKDEVDLSALLSLARCEFLAPRIGVDDLLSIHRYSPDALERHTYGFSQPRASAAPVVFDEIDVVLVPGRAFDESGGRLGRGGGYYDRLLASLPRGVVLVGITVEDAVVESVPTEPHDRGVDWIATERGVRRVGEPLHETTERFIASAIDVGIAPSPIRFPEGTKTSVDAANAIGCDLGAIAKSLVFIVDDEPVLVICSGDRRVDEARLCSLLGAAEARPATLNQVREISGFAGGGTPAVGHSSRMPVLVDTTLGRYRWVWSASGTPDTVYPVSLERLVAATRGRLALIAMGG